MASPVRFREDANLEEDLVLGGYRDRVVVELAQNAADAALRAGVPGRLRLTLDGRTLTAANIGAPLDADGVTGLSTLRASAKVGDAGTAGSPGSGSGRLRKLCRSGGIAGRPLRCRLRRGPRGLRRALHAVPRRQRPLLRRRRARTKWNAPPSTATACAPSWRAAKAASPVLRLPFPADGQPPQGFDTAVVLPLRDEAARKLVRNLLAGVDDALLLALPSLSEIVVDVDGEVRRLTAARDADGVCTITDGAEASRWRIVSASGPIDAGAAGRPPDRGTRPAELGPDVGSALRCRRRAAPSRHGPGVPRPDADRRAAGPARAADRDAAAGPDAAPPGPGGADRLPPRPGRRRLRGPRPRLAGEDARAAAARPGPDRRRPGRRRAAPADRRAAGAGGHPARRGDAAPQRRSPPRQRSPPRRPERVADEGESEADTRKARASPSCSSPATPSSSLPPPKPSSQPSKT